MRNLGDEQTYENSKYLFENSLKFKSEIELDKPNSEYIFIPQGK